MKINKNTASAYSCYEKNANNTMYIVEELHTFL